MDTFETPTNPSPWSQHRMATKTFLDVIKGSLQEKNNVLLSKASLETSQNTASTFLWANNSQVL